MPFARLQYKRHDVGKSGWRSRYSFSLLYWDGFGWSFALRPTKEPQMAI